ncbi:MAG: choice-of-anchor D domain-containing protein [Verrucomicrobiota bacterium]
MMSNEQSMGNARGIRRGKDSESRREPAAGMGKAGKNILRPFAAGLVLCGAVPSGRAASAFWVNPLSGDWSEGTNWGPSPVVPDNAGGDDYDVTIDAAGADYSILLDIGVTIDSLTLNSVSATIRGADLLEVLGTATLDQGAYLLDGGTLRGGIWDVGAGASLSMTSAVGNVLDGVTVNGDIRLTEDSAFVQIRGGTAFTTARMGGADSSMGFAAGESLTGAILFEGPAGGDRYVEMDGDDGVLTIGVTGEIRTSADLGATGIIGQAYKYGGAMELVNQGSISSETSGQLLSIVPFSLFNSGTLQALNGGILDISAADWTNAGTITLDADSSVYLGGNFDATGGIGTFSNAGGGFVGVRGLLRNTGSTLTLDDSTGSWTLEGGVIRGGTVITEDGKNLLATDNFDNLLDGVTLDGDLVLADDFAVVRIDGGTTFTTAHLTGYDSLLAFAPGQTLTGTVLFEGAGAGGRGVEMDGNDGTFTIGATGVIRTAPDLDNFEENVIGYGFDGGEMDLVNLGLISSETMYQQVSMDALSLTNSGTIQALDYSFLTAVTDSLTNSGTIRSSGGVVVLAAFDLINSGFVEAVDNGAVSLNAVTFTNSGVIRALRGSLVDIFVAGWSNGGTITLDADSTVNLDGVFDITGGLGTFSNPDGGTVNITGTLLNTGHTLTLNNAIGSWTLAGGTIEGGNLAFADGKSLIISDDSFSLLDGVTVEGDLTLSADEAVAGIAGGTTFLTAHLSGPDSSLLFEPGETLNGTVLFEGAAAGERGVGLNGTDGLLTIGPDGVIRTAPDLANGYTNRIGNAFASAGVMDLDNGGLISSETNGQLISLEPGAMINGGTLQALNGGTLRLGTALANYNVSTRTLTGGTWRVVSDGSLTTLDLDQGGNITVLNQASVYLSGANSVFAEMNALSDNQGAFTLADGRDFTTAGALSNSGILTLAGSATDLNATGAFTNTAAGLLDLQGGRLAGTDITNSGEISGFGTVTGRPVNHGTIRASGGALVFGAGIQGGSGTVQIDPGGSLDLSAGVSGSNADFLIHNGTTPGSLHLGANNFRVDVDYTNAGSGSGDTYNPRANITGAGEILAEGDVAQELTGAVTGGATAGPGLDFGNVHVGDVSTLNYGIANSGASGPALRGALMTTGGGGNITDPRLSGTGVTAGNFGPLATGTGGGSLAVTFTADTAGALSGQSVGIVNNFGNVGDQTLGITGAAYRLASPVIPGGTTVDFGIVHVGDSVSQALPVANNAAGDGFSESLNGSFSGSTAGVTTGGALVLLAPGGPGGSLTVGLNTTAAGTISGTADLEFVSDGAGGSGLGQTALTGRTVSVSGQVNNYANPVFIQQSGPGTLVQNSAADFTLDFGTIGNSSLNAAPVMTLGLMNDVPGSDPADTLAGSYLSSLNAFMAGNFNPFSGLAGGQTLGGLTISLDNSQNGVFSGSVTLSADSRNSGGYSGGLGSYVIHLQATVVPEPSGLGLMAAAVTAWRRRRGLSAPV